MTTNLLYSSVIQKPITPEEFRKILKRSFEDYANVLGVQHAKIVNREEILYKFSVTVSNDDNENRTLLNIRICLKGIRPDAYGKTFSIVFENSTDAISTLKQYASTAGLSVSTKTINSSLLETTWNSLS